MRPLFHDDYLWRAEASSVRIFRKGEVIRYLLLRMKCYLERDLTLHLFFRHASMLSIYDYRRKDAAVEVCKY